MPEVWPRWSYADLERLAPEGRRFELYDGEPCEVPSPLPRHQRVAQKIARRLEDYERRAGGLVFMAPIDIVLSNYDVVQPDVVFFASATAVAIDMNAPIRSRPDLAVEVLSSGSAADDRDKKMQLLARFGVPEYWLVDTAEQAIECYVLVAGAYVLELIASEQEAVKSRTLEGLGFPAGEIFGS